MRRTRVAQDAHALAAPDGISEPEPYNQVYVGRDLEADRLVSTVMLASAALAEPLCPAPAYAPLPYATPVDVERPLLLDDFDWLRGIVQQITDRLAEDPRRAELLARLTAGFGNGDLLRILFRNLFATQPSSPGSRNTDGRPVLSDREVDVLREVAAGRSHRQIAERLDIERSTVEVHLRKIYRKLGVDNGWKAVARAISMSFLPLDVIDAVECAASCAVRDFSVFDSWISYRNIPDGLPHADALRQLGGFALLLLTLAGGAAYCIETAADPEPRPGRVCRIGADGAVEQTFGREEFGWAYALAVAPHRAQRQGFTPGDLYVSQTLRPMQGPSTRALVQYTPDGRFVRAFCGGRDIASFTGGSSLAFAPDGRLLATAADSILAFADGGRIVCQFAPGCCTQVCLGPSGHLYATQYSGIGCLVKAFDTHGRLMESFCGSLPGVEYLSLAVTRAEEVLLARDTVPNGHPVIEHHDSEREEGRTLVSSFVVPGFRRGRLAIGPDDSLYVPCGESRDVKVVSITGAVLRRIALPDSFVPYVVALDEKGTLWVGGSPD